MTGTIQAIQHYAVHDGPGIRTLVFFKGCPLQCSWCCNPETQSSKPQLRYLSFLCKRCGACIEVCPSQSLHWKEETLVRSFEVCNACGSKVCLDACNHHAVTLSGRVITSEELYEIIARDIAFYRNSNGGVTFSGGEPLMQPSFLLEMLRKCKENGIHTAVDTCGWADSRSVLEILPYTDLFLFDLKIIDDDLHRIHTGQPVLPILENLALIAKSGTEVVIRFPLIPGITDTDQNLRDIAETMKKNGLVQLCLEPYHTLGQEKYEEHGMRYQLDRISFYDSDQVRTIQEFFLSNGLECVVS
jgi:pyruvate formate lyase activating enzyme